MLRRLHAIDATRVHETRPFGPRSTGDAPRRFGKDELLHFAYQIFDADDNGWISHEEFILLLSDLHPSTNRGRTTRALREIDLLDDGKLEYWEYLELNRRFPNLFYPVVEAQDKMRQKFFGTKHWHRLGVFSDLELEGVAAMASSWSHGSLRVL